MRKPNKARGEIALTVAGSELILCATMENLDALEQATGGKGISDLIADLTSFKVSTLKAALVSLTIEGDAAAAWSGMVGAGEMPAIQQAIMNALAPDEASEGNVASAAEKN